MKYLPIDQVQDGMVLVRPIFDDRGKLMLNSNTKLTAHFIRRIKSMGFEKIYVYEKYDDEVEERFYKEVLSEDLRMKAARSLKHLNIDAVTFYATEIVNELTSQSDILIDLADIRGYHDYTYQHSINVALMSVLTGISLGLNNEELKNLSIGAILHDIGKVNIDTEIIDKPGKLTDEEWEEMKRHPRYGYNMLKDNDEIASTSRVAVLFHHENEDGTGYYGRKSEEIHLFSKIIHIADVFDALVTERAYKPSHNPSEAIEYLMGNCGSMFNEDVLRHFLKYISIYPVGENVLLSNGEIATVVENHASAILRPTINLHGKIINLKKDFEYLNLTIIKQVD